MSENYSEAERRLIESRTQSSAPTTSSSSVDQLSAPRIDKRPEAKDVDLKGMVTKVNEASKLQQADAPTVFDTIDKDMPWLKWVGGALGVAYGINKLFGGDDNNTPPNNRPPSPQDRSIVKKEPTLEPVGTAQSSMTAGEPKIVADPVPVAPKPVTDVVTVPGTPDTTASIIPTTDQPKVVPVPSEARPPMQYGETKYNVPTASPEVAVAPPAEAAPTPVQPKPMTEIERLRAEKLQFDLEAARNKEARAQEAHATRMANEAKRAETKNQASQGKPLDSVETTMLKQSHQNTIAKAVEADVKANTPKPKAAPAASVAPPVAATPPAPTADKFVLPISSNPAETALTKEQMSARGWMANQYGGNNKYYESVQDIFGGVPPSYNAAAGEKAIGKDAHQVVMDWRKSNIEGPKVNLTHDMKKVFKGGGGMAVLMALPGFAEAAQSKDMGKMSDIFTDFFVLPFAQSREAGMSKREEESIIAGKFKEASKLGSPYRSVPPPR